MSLSPYDYIVYHRNTEEYRKRLYQFLLAEPKGLFVYFIAPLSNIFSMQECGFIKPRNHVTGYADLSGHAIQKNREKSLSVHSETSSKSVKTHDCLNFFFNPINNTFFAFRRNALIRYRESEPLSSVVGILEINLRKVFYLENVFWNISEKNLALSNSTVGEYDLYNWRNIYSLYNKDNENDSELDSYRAAEMVIHYGVEGLPFNKVVNRVLIFDSDIPEIVKPASIVLNPILVKDDEKVLGDPLHQDRAFAIKINQLFSEPVELLKILNRLSNIETEIGCNINTCYSNPDIMQHSFHGLVHTNSVMLWILVLAYIARHNNIEISDEELTTSLYAGFFHDLKRENERVDQKHGEKAACEFESLIKQKLVEPFASRCVNAIRVHALDKDPDEKDIVWILLKDADAIDRARFGLPGTQHGCNLTKLRLAFLKNDSPLRRSILGSAYALPKITNYINWNEHPCKDFVNLIFSSFQLVVDATSESQIPSGIKTICDSRKLARKPIAK